MLLFRLSARVLCVYEPILPFRCFPSLHESKTTPKPPLVFAHIIQLHCGHLLYHLTTHILLDKMKSIPTPKYMPDLLNLDDTILAGPETLARPHANEIFTPTHAAIIRLNACRVRRFFSIHLTTDNDDTTNISTNAIPAGFAEAMKASIADITDFFNAKNTIKNARLLQMAILRYLCFYAAGQYDCSIGKLQEPEDNSAMRLRRAERGEEEQEIVETRLWADAMERETVREQTQMAERREKKEQRKTMYGGILKRSVGKNKSRRGASGITSSSGLSTRSFV
jgi:hypothetical protein